MTIKSKRILMILALLVVAATAAFLLYETPSSQHGVNAKAKHPIARQARSVLLITIDTTRPDRLEPYGATNVSTPSLERLAERGVVFENASSVAPITLVAHTSMLTGLYPFEHGVRNNGIQYVSDSVTTLAERMSASGYRSAAFVSAAVLDRRYGLSQGFEVYDDDLSNRRNISPRMVADRPASVTVAAANKWLDGLPKDDKFFVWVHLYDPHASYSPPPPFRDDYRDRLYDGEIAYMDSQIGELLKNPRLNGSGNEQAIVAVMGDHGESLGEHGERTHAILAYNSTLHVPFILQIPGGPSGIRIADPVGQVDLAPTLLGLVGLGATTEVAAMAGRDLTLALEGRPLKKQAPYYSETFLPYYTYGWAKLRVLTRGRWKLIDAPTPELYDLSRDPRELTNLEKQESGVAHDMKRDLDEWLANYDADQEASLSLDSAEMAKLTSLGYLSVGSGKQTVRGERPNPMEMIAEHVSLENARNLLADRLYAQAIKQLESVLEKDPDNLAALIDLVRAKESEGLIDEAIGLAERALELDPEYIQTISTLARLEAQKGDLEQALKLAQLAMERDPINPDLPIQAASFLQRMGRDKETEKILRDALAAHPEHPRTNAVYAQMIEAKSGDLPAAEARLRGALERDPYLEMAWLSLGRLLERQQRADEALKSYRSGLQTSPDDTELHGAMGHLLARLGRFEEAEAQLREAIRLSPEERSELRVSLGGVLAGMGRDDEARKEYDRVLKLDPKNPGARNNVAIALYRSGKVREAHVALEQIVKDFPRLADAHNNLGAIAIDQEDWKAAIKHSRKTLEIAPELVEAWNNLAVGLEETGQLVEAEKSYRKAIALDSEYWQAYYNLALLLKKTDRIEAAVDAFNEVLSRVPNSAESNLELGELYAGPLQDPGKARKHWNAFLRHAAGSPRQAEIRKRLEQL